MDLARYVVEAVLVEGRSYREVARAHGVSKSRLGKMVCRFREGGHEALTPRSRAPGHVPHKTSESVEERIVALREKLSGAGFDAGAQTISVHLAAEGLDHLAGPEAPGVRHPAAPQTAEEFLGALRGGAAQGVVAVGCDPLARRLRQRGGDYQLLGRPLAPGRRKRGDACRAGP